MNEARGVVFMTSKRVILSANLYIQIKNDVAISSGGRDEEALGLAHDWVSENGEHPDAELVRNWILLMHPRVESDANEHKSRAAAASRSARFEKLLKRIDPDLREACRESVLRDKHIENE
jgi:hypothetical protein